MRVQSLIASLAILIFWSNDFACRNAIRILIENYIFSHFRIVTKIGISKNINNVFLEKRIRIRFYQKYKILISKLF